MNGDNGIAVTLFHNFAAREKEERTFTNAALAELVRTTSAGAKDDLPWLKLARFGDTRSAKGSLRHDANILAISGIEADYDGGVVWFYKAVEIAQKAGLGCILYTSPSHAPERPRWRILCPLSTELPPARRSQLLGWLHGLYGANVEGGPCDVFAGESWTLSQSYYFGSVKRSPAHRVVIVEGEPLDRLDELARIARPKPATQMAAGSSSRGTADGPVDEAALLELIRSGASYHNAAIRLIGHWARGGAAYLEAGQKLRAAFDGVFPADRDQRWNDRVADIPNLLVHVFGKDAARATDREQQRAEWEASHPGPGGPPDAAEDEAGWGSPPVEQPWPQLAPDALHGLAGETVAAIAPHTEADPVAILAQYLVMAGNAAGRGASYRVGDTDHHLNLFAVLVGATSKSRKGTSADHVRKIMEAADSDWLHQRALSGLSSGEGVIWHLRDEIEGPVKTGKGANVQYVNKVTDPGVDDKRLFVFESEFARVLTVLRRDGSTLSAVLRDAWDRGNLAILTKSNSARATGAHLSIVGHITVEELRRELDAVALFNGFANRFLYVCTRRAQELPFGGTCDPHVRLALAERTHAAIEAAGQPRQIPLSRAARELWAAEYHGLSADQPGLFGAVTARSEAQAARLALVYAMLDGAAAIDAPHLRAGLALWRYCADSARYIFGDALGDLDADEILRNLRASGPAGMTRTEIRDLFDRNRPGPRIGAALALLLQHGKARRGKRTGTGGRSAEIWVAV